MFILSCFVFGYLAARLLRKRARVPVGPMVGGIVAAISVFAILHVVYEFRAPWPNDRDYSFYQYVIVGRHRPSIQTGVLAFLLGFAVYLLRSRVLESLRHAGVMLPKDPAARKGTKARGFP
jgi:hypothetical protein